MFKIHIMYRSYKHVNDSEYLRDLDFGPFQVGEVFDDVDDSYWFASKRLETVIDVHAPMIKRPNSIIKYRQVTYMNSKLGKEINVRDMLRMWYNINKSSANWGRYRRQRNYVAGLKKKSKSQYLYDMSKKGPNGKELWNCMKPLFSCGARGSDTYITLVN